eukprot:jgi/Galph1/4673/GphlegSOOS_G3397.1
MSHLYGQSTKQVNGKSSWNIQWKDHIKSKHTCLDHDTEKPKRFGIVQRILRFVFMTIVTILLICALVRVCKAYIYQTQFQRRFEENAIRNPTFKLLGFPDEQVYKLAKRTAQEPENIAEVYKSEVFPYVVERSGTVRRPEVVDYFIFDFERWMNFTKEMKMRREKAGEPVGCM